jgi:hypothetical protein
VIGYSAFRSFRKITNVLFENGSKLREIAGWAFSGCRDLETFHVPSSVETLGPCCFAQCVRLTTMTFEDHSKLKRIGERAFSDSELISITIPAGTEEIDGSAFANCPIIDIRVAAGNRSFRTEGKLLLTFGGTEIVRYFGMSREVFVSKNVEVLRKSSFESCHSVQIIVFEDESELKTIGSLALADCKSLMGISIPSSVDTIEDAAFRGCHGLEYCLLDEHVILVKIGNESFAECLCLRSFYVPRGVDTIGANCFRRCVSLHRLKFESAESLQKVMGNVTLNARLKHLGFTEISSVFKLEVGSVIMKFCFGEWLSSADGSSHLLFIEDG